jgi:hypothetical protein
MNEHEPLKETTEPAPRKAPLAAIALAAGLLGGLGSWAIGETAATAFRPPLQRREVMGRVVLTARYEDQASADFKNALLASAILGGALGACLGLSGGLARGSTAAGLPAALAGLVLGGVLTSAASFALLPVYFRAEERNKEDLSHNLELPLLVHGGIWAAAGLAAGAAFGLGLGGGRNVVRTGLGGLIGALLGAVLYEMIGAFALPSGITTPPLPPDSSTRLLARLVVGLLTGLFAACFVGLTIRRPASPPRANPSG